MRRLFSRLLSRRIVALFAVILLALFFVRPGAGRLRWRAAQSMSQAFGRPVQIGSLQLRFLPRLGFELHDLVIYDDASFGSEPLLRAPLVNASLRFTSLLRGKIEISNLSLSQASLNLTRDAQGKWNLQDLLQGTSHLIPAQTVRTGQRSGFPYIEAEQARINFKIGAEKTHFAFTDAEFGLWQESESAWGLRLKARPMRTDANLTDTGVITVAGLWQRSAQSLDKPLTATFQWKQVQLGQASRLIFGEDKGWRGTVLFSGTLAGAPENLAVSLDASLDDFRRYEVVDGGDLRFPIHCSGDYGSSQNSFSFIDCRVPAGDGSLELTGGFTGLLSCYDLKLTSKAVPAGLMLGTLRHATARVPQNLTANGLVNWTLRLSRSGPAESAWVQGEGAAKDLVVADDQLPSPLHIQSLPFTFGMKDGVPAIQFAAINVPLGRPVPLQVRGFASSAGYEAKLRGDAGLKRLLQTAQTLHLPAPPISADGTATLDLSVSGNWNANGPPLVTGSAQAHDVTAQVRGLNSALEIHNASLLLAKDAIRVQNFSAQAADTFWKGSLLIPRPCPSPADCVAQFNLHSAELSVASLNKLLNPSARKDSWYKFFSLGKAPAPYLLQARASGKVTIDKIELGTSTATQFTGELNLDAGKMTLANFRAGVLGGRMSGTLKADFAARPPAYSGSGSVDRASLADVASLMHDDWMDGLGSAHYQFKTAGWNLRDLLATADLNADFAIQDGTFSHVVLADGAGSLQVSNFAGKLALHDGEFSVQDAKLLSGSAIYNVSGTAGLDGTLNMKMIGEGAARYDISGSFARTRVAPAAPAPTQASLKP